MLYSAQAVNRMRVLIVDADDRRRSALARRLRDRGFQGLLEVDDVPHARETLEELDRRGAAVDLAVLYGGPEASDAFAQALQATGTLILTLVPDGAEAPGPETAAGQLDLIVARIEKRLTERHYEVELTRAARRSRHLFVQTLEVMAKAIGAKDARTWDHSLKVSACAMDIARRMRLEDEAVETVRIAGLLHDLGLIGVREEILQKPGPLSSGEYQEVRRHPLIAGTILEPLEDLKDVIDAIRFHHERFDGRGYPHGLSGDAIPLAARIVAVAEAFDSMTRDRPYAPAMDECHALGELRAAAGAQFDPAVVDALVKCQSSEISDQ